LRCRPQPASRSPARGRSRPSSCPRLRLCLLRPLPPRQNQYRRRRLRFFPRLPRRRRLPTPSESPSLRAGVSPSARLRPPIQGGRARDFGPCGRRRGTYSAEGSWTANS
jgi:hypothetical protein